MKPVELHGATIFEYPSLLLYFYNALRYINEVGELPPAKTKKRDLK
jgi:hypothetical protein